MSDESRIRHIYEEWHRTVMSRDLAGLMVLYAEHAVFESPTVVAQFPDRADGVLRGRFEIEKLFARNFTNLATEFSDLHRTGFFTDGSGSDLGVSARDPGRRAGRPVRINGHRQRPDRLPPRLLGLAGRQDLDEPAQQMTVTQRAGYRARTVARAFRATGKAPRSARGDSSCDPRNASESRVFFFACWRATFSRHGGRSDELDG